MPGPLLVKKVHKSRSAANANSLHRPRIAPYKPRVFAPLAVRGNSRNRRGKRGCAGLDFEQFAGDHDLVLFLLLMFAPPGGVRSANNRLKSPQRERRKFMPETKVPDLAGDYRPTEDEDYMSPRQLAYFRAKLNGWKEEILKGARETVNIMQKETENHPDLVDRASSESDRALELRTRDRQRKLIAKIDEAISRIDDGSYGYCEETGEPIGLGRLEARPTATLSIEAQERHERSERVHRDD